ncbi:tol-pal system protein YbgF [Desulfuromonas sp. AOP6]|uniref:tol-pal system protein YbgF n=1 Tax=Desulfuromonas sp. AOP6 TaxID=1566351 RepID=UPI00126BBBBE|nr:tol-pal system protein YbgF [Desulfuromonas sp. AOP6]BCA78699.1 lipoprotein [Desulfuromonas sp. AOP6]
MQRITTLALTLLTASLTFGCVAATPSGDGRQLNQSLAQLANSQDELAQKMERLQDNMVLLEARVLDQQSVLDGLRQDMAAQKVTPAGQNTATTGENTVPAVVPEVPQTPTEIYLKAFGDYASGRYNQAISGFEAFLRTYPTNDYAGNAQYWLGECYYAQNNQVRAIEAFQKVVDNYPRAAKAPDALFRKAEALLQVNLPEQADLALLELRRLYPDSTAARKTLTAR